MSRRFKDARPTSQHGGQSGAQLGGAQLHGRRPQRSKESQRPRGAGFTLVELLVVIAIIGILVALLLPAVQAAREAARRSQCSSQLKQLSLGAISHHDTHKHFPTGGWGWGYVGDPDRGFGPSQPGGWMYNVLPFIEEGPLHDLGGNGDGSTVDNAQRAGARQVAQSTVKISNCPSRRAALLYPRSGGALSNALTPTETVKMDYAINSGHCVSEFDDPSIYKGPNTYSASDIDNYMRGARAQLQIRTADGSYKYSGISFGISQVAIRKITDGTSQTYLIGEKMVPVNLYDTGTHAGDNETWCTGFNNDNFRTSARNLGTEALLPIPDTDLTSANSADRFGSSHAAVWLMSFCDGSVHSMSYDVDWQVHRDLGNRGDGNVIDKSNL